MATVTPTVSNAGAQDASVIQYSWTLTTADNDGAPMQIPEHADITWVARGTWGSATLKFQGSANGTDFVTTGLANAAGGTEASITADRVVTTLERPLFIRPILTTTGSGANITVVALARRATPNRT